MIYTVINGVLISAETYQDAIDMRPIDLDEIPDDDDEENN